MSTERNAETHKAEADDLAEKGAWAAARQAYELAIRLKPDYFQAHANLANVLLREGETGPAIDHYQTAVKLRPDIAELHDSLGMALTSAGALNMARMAFLQALQIKPDLASAHYNLAGCLRRQARHDEALTRIDEAIRLAPAWAAAKALQADILMDTGALDRAQDVIRRLGAQADRLNPLTLPILQARLATVRKQHEEAVARWEDVLRLSGGDPPAQRAAWQSLIRIHDENGQHESAMRAAGNAHACVPHTFDRAGLRDRVQRLKAHYATRGMGGLPKANRAQHQPIFILGMPQSGKTLTERLLLAHPHIRGVDEGHLLADMPLPPRLTARGISRFDAERELTADELDRLAAGFVDGAAEYMGDGGQTGAGGVTHLVATAPGNVWGMPLIYRTFPRARFIHVVRDALDNCIACYFKQFANTEYDFTNRLDDFAFYARHYHDMMRHWRDVVGIPMLEIRFESLVRDPTGTRQQILDYLGLPQAANDAEDLQALFQQVRLGQGLHYRVHLATVAAELESIERESIVGRAVQDGGRRAPAVESSHQGE